MAFPASPTNGQQATVNGVVYTYSSALTAWAVTTSTSANISANNVTVTNTLSSGAITATGSLSGATIVATTSLTTPGIVNSGSNVTGNIGSSSNYFNTVFAKATSAQYADLAEKYTADAEYPPGTVVSFGGNQEITLSNVNSDTNVAGVVSTNPSYIMNAGLESEFTALVALTGRVPTRVHGPVSKGDMMVSAGDGLAKTQSNPVIGSVIGKALEDFSGVVGQIEVVVGRY